MVERRRSPAAFFLLNKKITNKKTIMKEQQIKDEKKMVITQIKETPFNYATNGEKNYVVCGKVLMETDKTEEQTKEWLKTKPYEAIALLCQAITNEMINEKNK